MFTVTKKSPQALFEQIKLGLRGEIEAGRFKPGDALPDENLLATQLSVSHMTVRRAIVELTRDGLLIRVSGKGTFVRDGFTPQPRARRGTIAVLSSVDLRSSTSLSYSRMLQAVKVGLEELGMPLVFRSIKERVEDTVSMLRQDSSLRGLIVIWGSLELIEGLAKLSIPVVVLDGIQPELPI